NACQRYPTDMDLIGAVGEALWENGVACGRFDHTVVAIVDYCKGCRDTFNLWVEAFSGIADPAAGRIKIEYTQYA
ncbi:hypothetical protein SO802_029841, partial [Lithocarpus litseifolius]